MGHRHDHCDAFLGLILIIAICAGIIYGIYKGIIYVYEYSQGTLICDKISTGEHHLRYNNMLKKKEPVDINFLRFYYDEKISCEQGYLIDDKKTILIEKSIENDLTFINSLK